MVAGAPALFTLHTITTMAIKLIANYSKRLGLPGYSSHQFEVSIETEITNPSEVQAVSANIYNTLQSAVDAQIQQVGFVPDEQYGRGNTPATPPSASLPAPSGSNRGNGYATYSAQPDTPAPSQEERWQCTEKQQSMILGQGRKCGMALAELDKLAQQRFGKPISTLNSMEASGIIKELMERTGDAQERGNTGRGGYNNRRPSAAYSRNGNRYGA